MKKPIRKAVFPVGGLGTRFLPATKSMPKEMLPVVDKPLIHYAFEEALEAGIEQFIFITGRNKSAINNHFDHSYELQRTLTEKNKEYELRLTRDWLPEAGNIIFIRQQEPLGLGHAVWCARHVVGDEPFAVLLADEMLLGETSCLSQMMQAYDKVGGNVIGVMEVAREKTGSYGILDIDWEEDGLIKAKGMVEKPAPDKAPSTLSVAGRYILQPDVFEHLEKGQTGAGGEIQLTDAIAAMIGRKDVYGAAFRGRRYDCGNQIGFIEANIAYAMEREELRERMKSMIRLYAEMLG